MGWTISGMAERRPRRYFDSDTILRLVENAPEAPSIEALITEAEAGQRTIVVSVVSMLEVTRERNRPVDPSKHARILSFFVRPFIFVRELDLLLTENALRLIYDYLWLRPNDAAHLAVAIDTGCGIFYTYDEELIRRFDGERGLRVQRPSEPPTQPGVDSA